MSAPDGTTDVPLTGAGLAQNLAMAAFTGIAWWNVLELNIAVQITFKRKAGLYYWSLLISSWGCLLHSIAFTLKFWGVYTEYIVICTIITIGWYAMVTGQSIVLWSRLHLILKNERILKALLYMICIDAVTMHLPTTVLTYGSNSPDFLRYNAAFNVMEKIQMTIFSIQEFIISGVYIWATWRFLKPLASRKKFTRSVMMQLYWINVFIVLMDVAMLTMEYTSRYDIEAMMKPMVYSTKLKCEFAVLNQVMRLASSSRDLGTDGLETHASGTTNSQVRNQARGTRPSFASVSVQGVKGAKGFWKRVLPKSHHPIPEEPVRAIAELPMKDKGGPYEELA